MDNGSTNRILAFSYEYHCQSTLFFLSVELYIKEKILSENLIAHLQINLLPFYPTKMNSHKLIAKTSDAVPFGSRHETKKKLQHMHRKCNFDVNLLKFRSNWAQLHWRCATRDKNQIKAICTPSQFGVVWNRFSLCVCVCVCNSTTTNCTISQALSTLFNDTKLNNAL